MPSRLPTAEEIELFLTVFVAGAVALGATGTAIESLGEQVSKLSPNSGALLVKVGQALEDFATNIPRLLGREKPRA
jgi:hypothetical protein